MKIDTNDRMGGSLRAGVRQTANLKVLTPDRQAARLERRRLMEARGPIRTEDDRRAEYPFGGGCAGLFRPNGPNGGVAERLIGRIGQIQAAESTPDEGRRVAVGAFELLQRPGGDAVAGVVALVLEHHHLLVEGGEQLVLVLELSTRER